MDGLLRQRRTRRTVGRSEAALSSQRSDYPRFASGAPAGRARLVPFLSPLRVDLGRDGKGRRAGCKGVWLTVSGGSRLMMVVVDQAALSGTCEAGGCRCVAMPCRRLSRTLRGRRRRRHRSVEHRRRDLGDVEPLRSRGRHRDPAPLLERSARSGHSSDQKGFNSRAIIDATRPYEWMKDFPAGRRIA